MEDYNSSYSGHSASNNGCDGLDSKRYTFGLNPPRHTSGGLLSSWLVDQQTIVDGHKWTLLCTPSPRRWDSPAAAPLTVLDPGMDQDSATCRSRNTSCRKVLTHCDGGCRPTPVSGETEWAHMRAVCQRPMYTLVTQVTHTMAVERLLVTTQRSANDPGKHYVGTKNPNLLLPEAHVKPSQASKTCVPRHKNIDLNSCGNRRYCKRGYKPKVETLNKNIILI